MQSILYKCTQLKTCLDKRNLKIIYHALVKSVIQYDTHSLMEKNLQNNSEKSDDTISDNAKQKKNYLSDKLYDFSAIYLLWII